MVVSFNRSRMKNRGLDSKRIIISTSLGEEFDRQREGLFTPFADGSNTFMHVANSKSKICIPDGDHGLLDLVPAFEPCTHNLKVEVRFQDSVTTKSVPHNSALTTTLSKFNRTFGRPPTSRPR